MICVWKLMIFPQIGGRRMYDNWQRQNLKSDEPCNIKYISELAKHNTVFSSFDTTIQSDIGNGYFEKNQVIKWSQRHETNSEPPLDSPMHDFCSYKCLTSWVNKDNYVDGFMESIKVLNCLQSFTNS